MNDLYYPIIVPVAAGVVCLLIPKKLSVITKILAVLASVAAFAFTINLFTCSGSDEYSFLRNDGLSRFVLLGAGFFGVVTVIYSLGFMKGRERLGEYYGYILMSLGAACGALLADEMILLLAFWGFLGLTLYLLIGVGGPASAPAAKKALIIVGGTDALMIMGVALLFYLTKTDFLDGLRMSEFTGSRIVLTGTLPVLAYLLLAIGCFAKAGAMPVHTWIPDMAVTAPTPVTAFLPASLDKLLGIYLLARISLEVFELVPAMNLVLLIVGAVTIIGAVMMALVQHDLRKLLSYHAVSQVGYMVLGIGTGTALGIAGGIFHMLNHSIYKACLFLSGGAVEHRTGTTDLGKLGGLARFMPITFAGCLIAALSISGVPPFNGFVSKWMIYQGVIQAGGNLWFVWLVAAMFGSALTLASFAKLIHAIFLGQKSPAKEGEPAAKEVSVTMWVPIAVLAFLCVLFGVFAHALPLKYLIFPAVKALTGAEEVVFPGIWAPGLATLMLIGGIALGLIIYLLSNIKGLREDSSYIGGEVLPEEARVTGVDFYGSIKEMPFLKSIYEQAEQKVFDIYDQGRNLVLCISEKLREFHTGVLRTYLVWCLLGMLVLLFVLMT